MPREVWSRCAAWNSSFTHRHKGPADSGPIAAPARRKVVAGQKRTVRNRMPRAQSASLQPAREDAVRIDRQLEEEAILGKQPAFGSHLRDSARKDPLYDAQRRRRHEMVEHEQLNTRFVGDLGGLHRRGVIEGMSCMIFATRGRPALAAASPIRATR